MLLYPDSKSCVTLVGTFRAVCAQTSGCGRRTPPPTVRTLHRVAAHPQRWFLLRLMLFMLILPACKNSEERAAPSTARSISHPTQDNLPGRSEVTHTIPMGDGIHGRDEIHELARALLTTKELLTIGVLEGDDHEMLGRVDDIAVDHFGNIFILDSRRANVRIFHPDGSFITSFGRAGEAPGEFWRPHSLAITSQRQVMVMDSRAITVFDHVDSTVVLDTTVHVPFAMLNGCAFDSDIFAHAIWRERDKVIHAIGMADAQIHSFRGTYSSNSPLVRSSLSLGNIACDTGTNTVVFASRYFPVVTAYSRQGVTQWITTLSDFQSLTITENQDERGLGFYTNADGFSDEIRHIQVAFGSVIVQVARQTPESVLALQDYGAILTYILDIRTGNGLYVNDSLPFIYHIGHGRVYMATNTPYPQVVIYEINLPSPKS